MPSDETLVGIVITGKKNRILIWRFLENVQKRYNFLELEGRGGGRGGHLFLPPN